MIRTLTALVAATALVALATPAQAEDALVTCVGTKSTSYTPGLILTPTEQHIEFEETLAPCLSTEAVTSATVSDQTTKSVGCLSLGEANPGDSVVRWNTGETSKFVYQTTVQRPTGQLVITKTGTITEGKFAGATAVEVNAGVTPDVADCLAGGVQSVNSTVTFTIAGL